MTHIFHSLAAAFLSIFVATSPVKQPPIPAPEPIVVEATTTATTTLPIVVQKSVAPKPRPVTTQVAPVVVSVPAPVVEPVDVSAINKLRNEQADEKMNASIQQKGDQYSASQQADADAKHQALCSSIYKLSEKKVMDRITASGGIVPASYLNGMILVQFNEDFAAAGCN